MFHASQLVDAWGLFWTAIFWKHGWISAFKTSKEIHIQYSVIFEHHPEINYGKFTCAGWTMSQTKRICLLLAHHLFDWKKRLYFVTVNLFTSIALTWICCEHAWKSSKHIFPNKWWCKMVIYYGTTRKKSQKQTTLLQDMQLQKTPIQYNIPIQSIAAQTTNPKT